MQRRLLGPAAAVPAALVGAAPAAAASGSAPPARGAAIGQVIGATLGMTIVTAGLLALIAGHRSGRIRFLGRAADALGRATGVTGWSALPTMLLLDVSLLTAVFGMYWDISIHLDNGRDPGPLANPAHYFILAGLFGVFASGVIAIALTGERRPGASAVRLPNGWWAPLGALAICACGAVSLIAFPLDDIWHRIFGQDVTLWGPTHLLLIGGATFSILGAWVLHAEGVRETRGTASPKRFFVISTDVAMVGAFLVGASTFQAEFDFGVPQFRMVWQPLLLAAAAGLALVAARVRIGRGGALAAVLFFIGLRGLIALIVGPILGQTTPHLPLYLVEAGIVELVALRLDARRPIALGAVAGPADRHDRLRRGVPLAGPDLLQPVDALARARGRDLRDRGGHRGRRARRLGRPLRRPRRAHRARPGLGRAGRRPRPRRRHGVGGADAQRLAAASDRQPAGGRAGAAARGGGDRAAEPAGRG
jgi:hypothetical protein